MRVVECQGAAEVDSEAVDVDANSGTDFKRSDGGGLWKVGANECPGAIDVDSGADFLFLF